MSSSDQPRPGRAATAPRQDDGPRARAGQQPGGATAASATTSHTRPARPASGPQPPPAPRRVRLTISRVDPWSVMKLSFLLSVAIGIAIVVATAVLWSVLDGMGVFGDVNRIVQEILADPSFDVHDYVGFTRVVSLATVVAVVDVVLATAIATLGAFLYNLASTLVGGLHLTLSDD